MDPHALLDVVEHLVADRPDRSFWLFEVFERVCFTGPHLSVTDVRTVLTRDLCVNPLHPVTTYGARIERLERGRYRLLDDITLSSAAD